MTALVKTSSAWSIAPSNLNELISFAGMIANSDLVPKDYRGKPGNVVIAIQMGADVGLTPMQSIQNIAVINGRATLWGDAMLALVQRHEDFVDFTEWESKDPKKPEEGVISYAKLTLKGREPIERAFSENDVKRAQLAGVHKQYPSRMRQMRARGFCLRDGAAYILKGFHSAEEQQDIVQARVIESSPSAPFEPPPKQLEGDGAAPHQRVSARANAVVDQPAETPSAPDAPRFSKHWKADGGMWAGKPLASASPLVLSTYIRELESKRDSMHIEAEAKQIERLTREIDVASKVFDDMPVREAEKAEAAAAGADPETGEVQDEQIGGGHPDPDDEFRGASA